MRKIEIKKKNNSLIVNLKSCYSSIKILEDMIKIYKNFNYFIILTRMIHVIIKMILS